MNTNLYKKDFRKDLKVLFFITLAMLGFLAITLSMYSAMKDSMSAVTDLYSTMRSE